MFSKILGLYFELASSPRMFYCYELLKNVGLHMNSTRRTHTKHISTRNHILKEISTLIFSRRREAVSCAFMLHPQFSPPENEEKPRVRCMTSYKGLQGQQHRLLPGTSL
jgi:hypothetical protein